MSAVYNPSASIRPPDRMIRPTTREPAGAVSSNLAGPVRFPKTIDCLLVVMISELRFPAPEFPPCRPADSGDVLAFVELQRGQGTGLGCVYIRFRNIPVGVVSHLQSADLGAVGPDTILANKLAPCLDRVFEVERFVTAERAVVPRVGDVIVRGRCVLQAVENGRLHHRARAGLAQNLAQGRDALLLVVRVTRLLQPEEELRLIHQIR